MLTKFHQFQIKMEQNHVDDSKSDEKIRRIVMICKLECLFEVSELITQEMKRKMLMTQFGIALVCYEIKLTLSCLKENAIELLCAQNECYQTKRSMETIRKTLSKYC